MFVHEDSKVHDFLIAEGPIGHGRHVDLVRQDLKSTHNELVWLARAPPQVVEVPEVIFVVDQNGDGGF